MASRIINAGPEQPQLLEAAARTALESLTGRALTEEDWVRERARLLEFVTILRAWDQQAKTSQSKAGRVVKELPCQREP